MNSGNLHSVQVEEGETVNTVSFPQQAADIYEELTQIYIKKSGRMQMLYSQNVCEDSHSSK